jgi:hypothetical protein
MSPRNTLRILGRDRLEKALHGAARLAGKLELELLEVLEPELPHEPAHRGHAHAARLGELVHRSVRRALGILLDEVGHAALGRGKG